MPAAFLGYVTPSPRKRKLWAAIYARAYERAMSRGKSHHNAAQFALETARRKVQWG